MFWGGGARKVPHEPSHPSLIPKLSVPFHIPTVLALFFLGNYMNEPRLMSTQPKLERASIRLMSGFAVNVAPSKDPGHFAHEFEVQMAALLGEARAGARHAGGRVRIGHPSHPVARF